MGRCEDGSKIYLNRLSEKLDLENTCYRAAAEHSAFIFGVICRIGDSLIDAAVVFLRKTIYRESALPYELTEGTQITHLAGQILDHLIYGWKRLRAFGKRKSLPVTGKWNTDWRQSILLSGEYNTAVSRSMSFGLFFVLCGIF